MGPLRVVLAVLLAAAMLTVFTPGARAFNNGQLPPSVLAHIETPAGCTQLARPAAAAYNAMRLAAHRRGVALHVNGCDSAYRTLARQVFFRRLWCARGACGNAAIPGTSNHGLGVAIDVDRVTRQFIDQWGPLFGWCKQPHGRCMSDAPGEWWHVRWTPGIWTQRPDPGTSLTTPLLVEGAGGPGLHYYVHDAQVLLKRQGALAIGRDGEYGPQTRKAVIRFQAAHKLAGDGVIGPRTWAALRGPIRAPQPPRKPTPKVVGPVNGVDVSEVKGDINWTRVRGSGREFAIAKTSEGQDFRDHRFSKARMQAIRKAGLVAGVYHFLRPRAGRAGAVEATFAVQVARTGGWGRGDLPMVADLETTTLNPAATCAYARSFSDRVLALTLHRPIVYTGFFFIRDRVGPCPVLAKSPLWVAAYQKAQPRVPAPWGGYTIWQHTDAGQVPGIVGGTDLDVLPGGRARLAALRMG